MAELSLAAAQRTCPRSRGCQRRCQRISDTGQDLAFEPVAPRSSPDDEPAEKVLELEPTAGRPARVIAMSRSIVKDQRQDGAKLLARLTESTVNNVPCYWRGCVRGCGVASPLEGLRGSLARFAQIGIWVWRGCAEAGEAGDKPDFWPHDDEAFEEIEAIVSAGHR